MSENESADSPTPLSDAHARILGCLIEKEATTPESYPLTANSLVLACNQKNAREPLMELEPGEVGHALRQMEADGLVRSIHGARAQRYEHRFAHAYSVTAKQQGLLGVLLLRGAQTASELLTRSERIAGFADLDELRQTLDRLAQRSPALVINIGRGPGQREDRYMHLLGGPVDAEQLHASSKSTASSIRDAGDDDRFQALESRIEALEAELAALKARLAPSD
ncbi:YceH family protein [Arenimonas sp.]|uniref:YceH family protein n=1 Tax=Arenimonas sp. TaxID=1872635 RepID=UPI0039E432A7